MKFGKNTHGAQRMSPNDLIGVIGDPLAFPQTPP